MSGFLTRRGPYLLAWNALRHGFRGKSDKLFNEKLALYNVRAFLKLGDVKKAYALAMLCVRSSDAGIAAEAASIKRTIEAVGGDYLGFTLDEAWKDRIREERPYGVWALAASAFAVGAIVIGFAWVAQHSYWSVPKQERTCNGVFWGPARLVGDPGNTLEFHNASNFNALIKIRDASSNSVIAAFFILKYEMAVIHSIPDGTYKVQYGRGGTLGSACNIERDFKKTGQFIETPVFPAQARTTDGMTRELSFDLDDYSHEKEAWFPISAEAFGKP